MQHRIKISVQVYIVMQINFNVSLVMGSNYLAWNKKDNLSESWEHIFFTYTNHHQRINLYWGLRPSFEELLVVLSLWWSHGKSEPAFQQGNLQSLRLPLEDLPSGPL